MKSIIGVLLIALLAVTYQLTAAQGEIIETQEQVTTLQSEGLECAGQIAAQNADIALYQSTIVNQTNLLKQSAARQVDLVLRQPQIAAKDAIELNAWLTDNFGVQQDE